MTAPFPFDAWAKPGKDAFDFWISFFPTAPLFGVPWRFADMVNPALAPFMQAGTTPFAMPFPNTRAAGAAARPGELDTPARADESEARPVARAAGTAADTARDATRIAAETGKAVARSAGAATKADGDAASGMARGEQNRSAAEKAPADRRGEAPAKVAETAAKAGEAAAGAAGNAGKGAKIDGATDPAAKTAEKKAEARRVVPSTAATAVETAAPAKKDEKPENAIAAARKPKMLLDARPDDADDLTMLKGVGPSLEQQLNGLGVWKLEQIAKMSDADLAWIDANLTTFKGRCFRDDWIGQAKARLAR